jgi:hypothetical protein
MNRYKPGFHAVRKTPGNSLRFLLSMLCLWLCVPGIAASQNRTDENAATGYDTIVTVNIPTELFMALITYQELSEAETEGKETVVEKLIPVLKSMIEALESERRKLAPNRSDTPADPMTRTRIAKLDRHLADFRNELRYRRKLLEYQRLKEKQKALIEGD